MRQDLTRYTKQAYDAFRTTSFRGGFSHWQFVGNQAMHMKNGYIRPNCQRPAYFPFSRTVATAARDNSTATPSAMRTVKVRSLTAVTVP